jgi:hypothetical protein
LKYINNLIINSTINNQIKFKAEILVFLIIFNRLKLTKKLLKSLGLLKPNKIYIAADGPRDNNLNDFRIHFLI